MYKILIVDDEPAILHGLVEVFKNYGEEELDIYSASMSKKALEILSKVKIDVILTDIHMPNINGITLAKEAIAHYKHCKIIFLTGYCEFDYAYSALQMNSAQYILKSESDSVIKDAVSKALDEIKEIKEQEVNRYRIQLHKEENICLLKKEALFELINEELIEEKFNSKSLNWKLSWSNGVYPLLISVNEDSNNYSKIRRVSIIKSIKDIVEDYIDKYFKCESIISDSKIIMLLQRDNDMNSIEVKNRLKVLGEEIQNVVKQLFDILIDIAFTAEEKQLNEIKLSIDTLKKILNRSRISNTPRLITGFDESTLVGNSNKVDDDFIKKSIYKLDEMIWKKDNKGIIKLCNQIKNKLNNGDILYMDGLANYYYFMYQLYRYFNKICNENDIDKAIKMKGENYLDIINLDVAYENLMNFIGYFDKVIEINESDESNLLVKKLEKYIIDNIGGDISLVKLADVIHFNPSYLSRFYKQITGKNISDFIKEVKIKKSKELLENSDEKISRIAVKLGFESTAYFSAFFKKNTGITPVDYRILQID